MSTNSNALVSTIVYHAIARVDPKIADDFRRTFVEPTDSTIPAQIRAINSYWQLHLGQVSNADSIQAREALIECELEDWLRLFDRHVAPRLPRLMGPH